MISAREANENVPQKLREILSARGLSAKRPLRPEAKAEFAKFRLIMYNNIAG